MTPRPKKKRAKANKTKKSILPGVLIIIIILGAFAMMRKSEETPIVASEQATARVLAEEPNYDQEAKAVGDTYFEAAKQCDLEKANSLRLIPVTIQADSVEKCKKNCSPTGLSYSFEKQWGKIVSEYIKEVEMTSDSVTLAYTITCKGEDHTIPLNMIRWSDDNKWQILSAFGY